MSSESQSNTMNNSEYDSDIEESTEESSIESNEDCETSSLNKTSKSYNSEFEVLTTEQVVEEMELAIGEINAVVEMPATTTRILLSHVKWDKQELLDKVTSGDCSKFFEEAHVLDPFKKKIHKKPPPGTEVECIICFSEFHIPFVVDLGCGHSICKDCWSQYLKLKIIDDGVSELICCPAVECGIIVNDVKVMKLVKNKKAKTKYRHLMTNSFVEHNRSMRWCPSPGCTYAIKSNKMLVYRTTCGCKCGKEFCFNCGEDSHDPISCEFIKKWQLNGNEKSLEYFFKKTKPCPKCKSLIEKNGGCNHMKCSRCFVEFCWLCSADWKNHQSCNTFKAVDPNDTMLRFQHYFKRYMAHKRSMKYEKRSASETASKLSSLMKSSSLSWTEVQFVKESAEILVNCRKQLMYSYIFANYVEPSNQKTIFEINQSDLEAAVEALSYDLQQHFEEGSITRNDKEDIMSKSSYCDKRRQQMADHIYEGYNMDWWTFAK